MTKSSQLDVITTGSAEVSQAARALPGSEIEHARPKAINKAERRLIDLHSCIAALWSLLRMSQPLWETTALTNSFLPSARQLFSAEACFVAYSHRLLPINHDILSIGDPDVSPQALFHLPKSIF
jgi:hypothetical protein